MERLTGSEGRIASDAGRASSVEQRGHQRSRVYGTFRVSGRVVVPPWAFDGAVGRDQYRSPVEPPEHRRRVVPAPGKTR